MSNVNHSFNPVWLENGKCPSAKRHFRGCAREVYGYLEKLAENHGGFVFPTVADIARHTKKWKQQRSKCIHDRLVINARPHPVHADDNTPCRFPDAETYSLRECKRVMRIFREFGILGKSCVRKIHGRRYQGWQFYPHENWAESGGGLCELKHWERYDLKSQQFMHNDGTANGTQNGTLNGTDFAINGTLNGTEHSAVIDSIGHENQELRAAENP